MMTIDEVNVTITVHTDQGVIEASATMDGKLFVASRLLPADQLAAFSRPYFEAVERLLLEAQDAHP